MARSSQGIPVAGSLSTKMRAVQCIAVFRSRRWVVCWYREY